MPDRAAECLERGAEIAQQPLQNAQTNSDLSEITHIRDPTGAKVLGRWAREIDKHAFQAQAARNERSITARAAALSHSAAALASRNIAGRRLRPLKQRRRRLRLLVDLDCRLAVQQPITVEFHQTGDDLTLHGFDRSSSALSERSDQSAHHAPARSLADPDPEAVRLCPWHASWVVPPTPRHDPGFPEHSETTALRLPLSAFLSGD